MAEHFTPVYPFQIILTKEPTSRFFAKMFIFFFGTKKHNYEWSSTRFYFKPFMENIPQTMYNQPFNKSYNAHETTRQLTEHRANTMPVRGEERNKFTHEQ